MNWIIASGAASKLSHWAIFVRGIVITVVALVIFVGSIYLVLGTDIGFRRGLLVTTGCLFGFIIILSGLWLRYPAQAPRPHGPVCLFGEVNNDFLQNGGIAEAREVRLKQADGSEVAYPACDSGMNVTSQFYPGLFLIFSLLLMGVSLWGLNKLDKFDAEAEGEPALT